MYAFYMWHARSEEVGPVKSSSIAFYTELPAGA